MFWLQKQATANTPGIPSYNRTVSTPTTMLYRRRASRHLVSIAASAPRRLDQRQVLHNVPDIFSRVTELAASNTSRQRVVADGDFLVNKRIGEVILTLSHSANEDTDAILGIHSFNILTNLDKWRIETQSNLAAIGRQVVSDGVLDHSKQLLVRVGGADGQTVQELHHQTGKSLECSWNTD